MRKALAAGLAVVVGDRRFLPAGIECDRAADAEAELGDLVALHLGGGREARVEGDGIEHACDRDKSRVVATGDLQATLSDVLPALSNKLASLPGSSSNVPVSGW